MNKTENSQDPKFGSKINEILNQFIFYSSVIGLDGLILCNIFNVLICLRKRIRQEMMGFYNVIISFWNILTLSFALIFYFPPTIHAQDIALVSDFLCASLNYALRLAIQARFYAVISIFSAHFLVFYY